MRVRFNMGPIDRPSGGRAGDYCTATRPLPPLYPSFSLLYFVILSGEEEVMWSIVEEELNLILIGDDTGKLKFWSYLSH